MKPYLATRLLWLGAALWIACVSCIFLTNAQSVASAEPASAPIPFRLPESYSAVVKIFSEKERNGKVFNYGEGMEFHIFVQTGKARARLEMPDFFVDDPTAKRVFLLQLDQKKIYRINANHQIYTEVPYNRKISGQLYL